MAKNKWATGVKWGPYSWSYFTLCLITLISGAHLVETRPIFQWCNLCPVLCPSPQQKQINQNCQVASGIAGVASAPCFFCETGNGGLGKMLKADVLLDAPIRVHPPWSSIEPVFPLKRDRDHPIRRGEALFQRSYFLQVLLLLIFWVEWYGNRVTEEKKVTQMPTSPGQHLITKLAYGIFESRMSVCLTTTQTQPRS